MCFLRLSALKECEETLRTKINHFLFTGLRSAGGGRRRRGGGGAGGGGGGGGGEEEEQEG